MSYTTTMLHYLLVDEARLKTAFPFLPVLNAAHARLFAVSSAGASSRKEFVSHEPGAGTSKPQPQ
jgi:hypothetical protein